MSVTKEMRDDREFMCWFHEHFGSYPRGAYLTKLRKRLSHARERVKEDERAVTETEAYEVKMQAAFSAWAARASQPEGRK